MKLIKLILLPLVFMTAIVGCQYKESTDSKQGIWVSQEYGFALEIVSNSVAYYEFTPDYCFHTATEAWTDSMLEKRYKRIDDTLFQFTYPGLTENSEDYGFSYTLSDQLPTQCTHHLIEPTTDTRDDDPERDLELFLQTFEHYYYDFEAAGVDWTYVEQVARSAISAQSTRDELFDMLAQAISPLQNGHVYLLDNEKIARSPRYDRPVLLNRLQAEYLEENNLTLPLSDSENEALAEYIEDNDSLIQAAIIGYFGLTKLAYAANDNIIWGIHNNIGYLNILGFSDFTATNDHEETLALMHQVMQQVIQDFDTTDGLVIDLRFNGGGYAYLARALAEYFVSSETLGYIKSARYGNDFTPEQNIYLNPKIPNYTKPVAVLISNTTASAAELAVFMLSVSDHVKLIGERTQGMLSGSLAKKLPNGFIFGISNMKTLSHDRLSYEQEGIPAEIDVPFASKSDRVNGIDSGLEAAFNWIESVK